MKETYRCWAEIDRAALRHNVKVVRDRIGSAEMLAVVKANAYGHGLVGIAQTLADEVQLFGVANLQEALTLRESLPHPIVILGPATPEERPVIAEHGFIPTISSLEEAQAFDRLRPVSVNFKIDTGMGRMGVVQNEAREVFRRVAAMANVEIHSISTHMPVSNEDAEYTRDQLVRFQRIVDQIRAEVPGRYKAHVLQSAGTLAFNQRTFEIVRAGIILYGISPLPEFRELVKPVMTWKTRICLVRDVPKGSSISYGRTFITPRNMRVATLSAGYADGYPWHLSNRGAAVLVRGKRCPLLGRVTMDLIVIDVSGLDDAQVGAGARGAREAPDPAVLGEPGGERAAGDARERDLEDQSAADPPALADPRGGHVEPGGGEVLAEAAAGERAAERGGPRVEILARVGVDRLVIAAVVAPVADRVADEAAAQPGALRTGRTHLDRAVHGALVDRGHAGGRVLRGLRAPEVDR